MDESRGSTDLPSSWTRLQLLLTGDNACPHQHRERISTNAEIAVMFSKHRNPNPGRCHAVIGRWDFTLMAMIHSSRCVASARWHSLKSCFENFFPRPITEPSKENCSRSWGWRVPSSDWQRQAARGFERIMGKLGGICGRWFVFQPNETRKTFKEWVGNFRSTLSSSSFTTEEICFHPTTGVYYLFAADR